MDEPGSAKRKKDAGKSSNKPKDKHKTKAEKAEKKSKKEKGDKEHKKDKKDKKNRQREFDNEEARQGRASHDFSFHQLADEADASDGDEEADLWNSIGTFEAETTPSVPEVQKPDITVGKAEIEVSAPTLDAEDFVVQVPMDIAARVAEKLRVVDRVVKTAKLVMKDSATNSTISISGSTDAKKLACQCIQAIRDNRVPEGAYNATTVHVLPDWLDNWSGCRALEDELNVLIVFERLRGRAAFAQGQVAGLLKTETSREGREFEQHQPVIVKKMSPGGNRVQATWCKDGLLEEAAEVSKLQAAVRVGILGSQESRALAVLRILSSADQGAQGLLASQMEVLRNNDVFGCDGGPGGPGLQQFDLKVEVSYLRKLLRIGGYPDEKGEGNEYIDRVREVSQCSMLHLYQLTTGKSASYRGTSHQLLIALGSRKQRWLAFEMMRMLLLIFGGQGSSVLGSLPTKLGDECSTLLIPSQALGPFWGKQKEKFRTLMKESKTIIVPIRELTGSEAMDISEVENFVTHLYKAAEAHGTEFAFFGSPVAQQVALAKSLLVVERKVPGYIFRASQSNEEIDQAERVGLDKIRLSYDFQEDANNAKAAILSTASGCHVECLNDLILLAGGSKERQRARDYARLMGKPVGKKFPSCEDGDSRADMYGVWVNDAASKSKWFQSKLTILMEECSLCAFFVDRTNDDDERRLYFAGRRLEEASSDADKREILSETLEKMQSAVESVLGKRSKGAWWSEWSWQRNKRSYQASKETELQDESDPKVAKIDTAAVEEMSWQGWNWNETEKPSTTSETKQWTTSWQPSTTSETKQWTTSWQSGTEWSTGWDSWSSWEWSKQETWKTESRWDWESEEDAGKKQPVTPAGFGPHGNSAPQTPAPKMRYSAPQTPAGFGPHGSAAPQTPAFPNPSNTPQRHLPEPATPAFPKSSQSLMNRVPDPRTPAFHKALTPQTVPDPATPAFANNNRVPDPRTPAFQKAHTPQTVPDPATPAFANNNRVPDPHTPAFQKAHTPQAVPDPATPAFANKTRVPEPATPAFHKGHTPQATQWRDQSEASIANAVPPPATPARPKIPEPATPAAFRQAQPTSFGTNGGASTAPAPEDTDLPPGWQKCISKKYGKPYYFNAQLRKSQYERPTA